MRVIDADRLRNIALSNRDAEMVYEIDHSPTVEIPIAELDNTEDFGEWIDRSDGGRIRYPFWERYECSKCGAKSEDTNFCPNCGSDNRPRILDEAVNGEGKDGNVKEGESNE